MNIRTIISITAAVSLTLAACLFTGCGQDQVRIQDDFMAILDKPATDQSIKEASQYLDKYISYMDQEHASSMVAGYEDYLLSYDTSAIDYEKLVDSYKDDIDPALTELYKIKEREEHSPMQKDAVLQITWPEIAQRAYELETFISKNKDKEFVKADGLLIYNKYINALLMGTTSTPLFDYKTYEISNEAKKAYNDFIEKHPDSATAGILKEYFVYLDGIGYKMNYNDKTTSAQFFKTCAGLVTESGKRVLK